MKIGLMGGTFDPIHNAHIKLAEYAAAEYKLDRVIFMTGGNPPHKSEVTDAKIRYEAVKLALADIPKMTASDYEVKLEEPSYSVNTLRHMHKEYPGAELYFIIGEDSLAYFEDWYEPEEILKLCTLLVYPRTGKENLDALITDVKKRLGGRIESINAPVFNISSTQIREYLKNGKDVSDLVDKKILGYIKENNLYRGDNE